MDEREFLKLAGFMLASKYEIMGGRVIGLRYDLSTALLGYMDCIMEMELIIQECRSKV